MDQAGQGFLCACSANPCNWPGHGSDGQCQVQVTEESTCIVCRTHNGGMTTIKESIQQIGRHSG